MQPVREDIKNARIYGAVGVALRFFEVILLFIPYIESVLGVVVSSAWLLELVLVVLAFYKLSKGYNRPGIFRNFLIHLVLETLTLLPLLVLAVVLLDVLFGVGILSARYGPLGGLRAIAIAVVFFLIYWFLLIAANYFYYKSVAEVSEASGIELFRWSGIARLAGAATMVILIGLVPYFFGWILLLVGFLVLKPPQEPQQQATPEPTVSL